MLDCKVVFLDGDPYGRLASANLKLRGYMLSSGYLGQSQQPAGSVIWQSPPFLNSHYQAHKSHIRQNWLQKTNDKQAIYSFDLPPDILESSLEAFRDIRLLHISSWVALSNWEGKGALGTLVALILCIVGQGSSFRHAGIAEFPLQKTWRA